MLYYDRVHLIISAQMFSGLWRGLGSGDMSALLRHPTITATITPEFLAVKTEANALITTHRLTSMRMSGRAGGPFLHPKDDIGSLLQTLQNLPNGPGTRADVKRMVSLAKVSEYRKILGGESENNQRTLSLFRDQETLKLFVRGWARANGHAVNDVAINEAKIELVEMGDEFMIDSSTSLDRMIPTWNPVETWATILAGGQDYAVDLYLSNSYSADIVTSPENSAIASARIDMSLQRAFRNAEQISAFEEMAFDSAHAFSDAYNDGLITFAEALKVIDQSRRFRQWGKGLAPDANLLSEYNQAISKDTLLNKLPASLARFAIFNGAGMAADAAAPGASWLTSAFDTFVVDRIFGGWRPNIFVNNVRKTLANAQDRAFDRA